MTLPTILTLLRLSSTFLIMLLLATSGWVAKLLAVMGFALASATDWLDGYLARRWHQTSALGALLDPIADKVLVLGLFLAFVQLRIVPAWMVLIILSRELLITGVRLVAAHRGMILSAAKEGKHKTASQMFTILVTLILLLMRELSVRSVIAQYTIRVFEGMMWLCLGVTLWLTLTSGITFLWTHRAIFKDVIR